MVNIPIIPPVAEIHTDLLPDISQTWKVGQVLNATVERGGENLDKILLRIGHLVIESKTPLPLKTGEQIKLLVKVVGEAPLLAIITQPTTAQLAAQQLRPFISSQTSWLPLIARILNLLPDSPLPAETKPMLQNLLRQLPSAEQLSNPTSLRHYIERSGMLLETHLANKTANVTDDFKAQLLQLDKALQNVSPVAGRVSNPEQAIRFIENYLRNPQLTLAGIAQELGALINTADMQKIISAIGLNNIDAPVTASLIQLFAYIQKHQGTATLEKLLKLITDQNNLGEFKALLNQSLAHISQQQLLPMLRDADSALLLLFGLPLRHNNETHWINFRFEQEQSSTQQTATGWQVTLNFDIAALGPLQVKLHMKGQQLATTFYASQASTLEKIRHHLPQLQQILQRSGIEVLKLDVIPGQITPTQPVTAAHILDEQA